MKLFFRFLLGVAVGCLVSCDSSDEVAPDTGLAYLPLAVGAYQVYTVDETIYELSTPRTAAYELKVAVVEKFRNDAGDTTYVLYRYTRDAAEDAWVYQNTWSVRRNNAEAVVNEENTAFVKLKFPPAQGSAWDGNAYNALGEDEYTMGPVGESKEINGGTYADCLTVEQHDSDDYVVYLDQRKEVYARNIGLVYKEVTQLHYCTQPGCIGQQQVESGLILKQSIKAYGVE